MAIPPDELIEAGIAHGLLERDAVTRLRVESRQRREPLLETIARHGRFPTAALYRAWADQQHLPFVDLNITTIDPDLLSRLPETILRRRLIVPLSHEGNSIRIATCAPEDRALQQTLERLLGSPLLVSLADPESLQHGIDRALKQLGKTAGPAPGLAEIDPVAALERILHQAYLRRASDIHLEPIPHGMQVRLRIDGRLQLYLAGFNTAAGLAIVSRVKVLAGLDIAEQRAPQDGRFSFRSPGEEQKEIDVRVATVPTRWGERATLRLLGAETGTLSLENLGMLPDDLAQFRRVIRRPYGIILLTGPTGSGKTTTLYAALREINQPHLNIMTVEDPVEYVVQGVSQVHVGGSDKVTFASALRSLLRHDPDVLMVGEIRDHETADVAMKAAMTGHLLFSTLHTNSSCGAVTRLVDIGCEPFLVAATVVGVIAQRLVRRLCPNCKRPRPATADEARLLHCEPGVTIHEPVGCARCLGNGYYGRLGLFEPLWVDAELARLISRGASQPELEAHCSGTLKTLRADGALKVLAGLTSLEEVFTVTVGD